ncbi:MAG: hypothetical protein AB7L91_06385 [Dehalococcoidia bacterium]
MSAEQAAPVIEGDVLEGEVVDVPAAEVMACEHYVSKARVDRAWKRRRERPRKEDAESGMCGCCEMPCRPNAERCLVCSRDPYGTYEPRWPYSEQAQ